MNSNVIGKRVRWARQFTSPKTTQVELAELLVRDGLDIDQSQISKIENGSRLVFDYEVVALAKALRVSASWLLGETDQPQLLPQPDVLDLPPEPEPEPDFNGQAIDYSPAVSQLFTVGPFQDRDVAYNHDYFRKPDPPWLDYVGQLGLTLAHAPELLHLATHPGDTADDEEGESNPAWLHAWAALAQLGDSAMIPALFAKFVAKNEDWAIVVQEDLICIVGLLGAKAIAPLRAVFQQYRLGTYPPELAIRCLQQIGLEHPDAKAACIDVLAEQLKPYKRQDADYNGCVVEAMLELEAVQYKDLVYEAFKARKLDKFYIGGKESLDRVFKPRKFYQRDGHLALTGPNATPAKRQPPPITAPAVPHSLPVRPEPSIPFSLPFEVELDEADDPGLPDLQRELWTIDPPRRQYSYPAPVNQLLHLGPAAIGVQMRHWPDYQAMGIGPEHIPDLIRMALDLRLLSENYHTVL